MSLRIPFHRDWLFHDGEIVVETPKLKGPMYAQAKTENYRFGPAARAYHDAPDDFGEIHKNTLTYEKWQNVTLPHDYIIGDEPSKEQNNAMGYFAYRNAWYRKHFKAEEAWRGKRVLLELTGVSNECEVYFNGAFMACSFSAYAPTVVDLTDFIMFNGEDNVIAVHVTTHRIEGWWYLGAGITRKVYLQIKPLISVAQDGIYLCPEDKGHGIWVVHTSIELENYTLKDATASARISFYDRDGNIVSKGCVKGEIERRGASKLLTDIQVCNPALWDIDSPTLYTAVTEVMNENGEVIDTHEDRFGFRTFAFTADRGFFLNGRHVLLNGVCGHSDFGLTGRAVPDNIQRMKIRELKSMGANAYRCSHYIQDEATMDALDNYGMLVMAETRHFSSAPMHLNELRALIRRDRNRPSVIMWSIGNEEYNFITDEGRRIAEVMTCEVKKLDASRPVMTANDKSPEVCTVYDVSDVIGINYNCDIFDTVHAQHPQKAIFSSECCATPTTRGWYYSSDAPEHGYMSAYDKDNFAFFWGREHMWRFIHERPWLCGGFQWIGIDQRGETVWPRLSSQSGAIDMFLQRKDAFYHNRVLFSDFPALHLLPHWNMAGRSEVRVCAYTNTASCELFINGKSQGRVTTDRCHHAEWSVTFEPGELRAIGYDVNGIPVAEDIRKTASAPVALKLIFENSEDTRANGEDLAFFTCTCIDKMGIEVPETCATVTFVAHDGARIIGTGADPCDHTPVTEPRRTMFMGRISVAVLPRKDATNIKLTATAPGLDACTINAILG